MATRVRETHRRKHPITDIGRQVPSNLKFGIIVAIAILWAQFLGALLNGLFSILNISTPILTDLIIALVASAVGYLVLLSYRKIRIRLRRVKV
jgi:ABC-type sulfate transport system permease subunit